MASPSVSGTIALSARNTNATSHTLNVPGTTVTGERLIAVAAWDGDPTTTWPAGWTLLDAGTTNLSAARVEIYYKEVTSGSTGTPDETITTTTSETFAAIVARITGHDPSIPPSVGLANLQDTSGMNAPLLDPPWGSVDTLWLAVGGWDNGGVTVSSYPPSYTNHTSSVATGSGGCGVALATRALNAETENPGSFTLSAAEENRAVALAIAPAGITPTVTHRRVGAVSAEGFSASGKFVGATSVRLVASTSSTLATAPTYSGVVSVDADGIAKASVSGLASDTLYYWGWETNGLTNSGGRGECRTLKSGAHSFNFAFASCSQSGSNASVFTAIRDRNPALFLMIGDMHYENLITTNQGAFRSAWDAVLAQPNQQTLYANIPTDYVYDDHDFAGGNDANATSTGADVVPVVYRQYFPHYPLELSGTSGGIYRTYTVGRVRFIVLDTRRYRSPDTDTDDSSKTMLGSTQKAWLKALLLANRTELKFLVTPSAWIPNSTTGDNWGSYQTERTELANFIKNNQIRNLVLLSGDSHLVASDDGRNSLAYLPVFQAAPLDHTSNHTSLGTYQYGPSPGADDVARTQYGWVTVSDTGGSHISVTYNAYNESGTTLLTTQNLSFEVAARQFAGIMPIYT